MIDWSVVIEYQDYFVRGFITTIELTVVGLAFGLLIGLFLSLLQLSPKRLVRLPARIYIDIFRGTPLMLQVLAIHYAVIPMIYEDFLGLVPPDGLFSGFVALSLNAGAYIAEIIRAGVQSIEKGQLEAARSLGMSYGQAMRHVILPQAFRNMLPPLGNEAITLLKDSSLVTMIAVNDITYAAFSTAKNTFERLAPYLTAAIMYFVLTFVLSRLVLYLEKRDLSRGGRN
ncbi:amino acid ABC transporter permease [Risungbinella massiliensis]|uniref:amino acid ABC transporter permease n=1 Tax=Risungbinella massiliensis TaxID=1329796 RepID=UPI000A90F55B